MKAKFTNILEYLKTSVGFMFFYFLFIFWFIFGNIFNIKHLDYLLSVIYKYAFPIIGLLIIIAQISKLRRKNITKKRNIYNL